MMSYVYRSVNTVCGGTRFSQTEYFPTTKLAWKHGLLTNSKLIAHYQRSVTLTVTRVKYECFYTIAPTNVYSVGGSLGFFKTREKAREAKRCMRKASPSVKFKILQHRYESLSDDDTNPYPYSNTRVVR